MIDAKDCWIYAGVRNPQGYGVISYRMNGKVNHEVAHRATYRTFTGDIPDSYEVDHLCRNQSCINPLHLEAVTKLENIRRQWLAFGNTCKRGHVYTDGSFRVIDSIKNGKKYQSRVCKICIRLKLKERVNA